jgi:hypothetical protein
MRLHPTTCAALACTFVATVARAEPPPLADDGALSPEARLEYEEKLLAVDDEVVVDGGESHRTHGIYQGKYRKRIDEGAFYRLVGRPDYAEQHESNLRWVRSRFWIGSGVVLGGLTLAGAMCAKDDCGEDRTPIYIALGSAAAGMAIWASAVLLAPKIYPLEPPDMRRLADQHNRALRTRLSGGTPPPRTSERPRLRAILPYAAADGGGLVLGGSF